MKKDFPLVTCTTPPLYGGYQSEQSWWIARGKLIAVQFSLTVTLDGLLPVTWVL